jgi:flagellar L-ring protein precursor FlgH
MKKILATVIALLFAAFFIYAEDLSGDLNSLYTNSKTYKAGDTVRILINENATAAQSNETGVSRDFGLTAGAGPASNTTAYGGQFTYNNQNTGKGTATQSGVLQTEITVEVVEVKQNGYLVLKGQKNLQMNGNTQKISVEGEVNPKDIEADNTILSTKIVNAKIDYTGDGVLGNKSKMGFLSQVFDWLGIF